MPIEGTNYIFDIGYQRSDRELRNPIQVADSLMRAPSQRSPKHISNILCDDILRIIFRDPRFDLKQLIAIANVCTRFQGIAGPIFKAKFNQPININVDQDIEYNAPLWLVDDLFRGFGSLITDITVHGCPAVVMRSISRYCKNIEKITLSNRSVEECILPPFNREKLINLNLDKMKFADLRSIEPFFRVNPQLVQLKLHIDSSFGLGAILRHLPNLEVLKLHWQGTQSSFDNDTTCFEQLKCLKSLTLRHCDEVDGVLRSLITGDVQLEELKFNDTQRYRDIPLVDLIYQLKNLKWLRVREKDVLSLARFTERLDNSSEARRNRPIDLNIDMMIEVRIKVH